jgi:hypothetical protein
MLTVSVVVVEVVELVVEEVMVVVAMMICSFIDLRATIDPSITIFTIVINLHLLPQRKVLWTYNISSL